MRPNDPREISARFTGVVHKPPLGGSVPINKSAAMGQQSRIGLFEVRDLPPGPWVLKACAYREGTNAPIRITRNALLVLEHGFGGVMHLQTPMEFGMGDTIQLPAGNYFRGFMQIETPSDWVGVTNIVVYTIAPGVYPEARPVRTSAQFNVAALGNAVFPVPQFARRARIHRSHNDVVTAVFRDIAGTTINRAAIQTGEWSFRPGPSEWIWIPPETQDVLVSNDSAANAADLRVEWMLHC